MLDHHSANQETPLRKDAFVLSDAEKITRIEKDVYRDASGLQFPLISQEYQYSKGLLEGVHV